MGNKYVKQQPLSVVVVGLFFFGGGGMSPIPFTFRLCLLVLFTECKQGFFECFVFVCCSDLFSRAVLSNLFFFFF